MYHMNCNVFSISPDVVVSERGFTRLNQWLRAHGFTVEERFLMGKSHARGPIAMQYHAPLSRSGLGQTKV